MGVSPMCSNDEIKNYSTYHTRESLSVWEREMLGHIKDAYE